MSQTLTAAELVEATGKRRAASQAAVLAEREAIAQMVDAYAVESAGWTEEEATAQKIAEMIRARGE